MHQYLVRFYGQLATKGNPGTLVDIYKVRESDVFLTCYVISPLYTTGPNFRSPGELIPYCAADGDFIVTSSTELSIEEICQDHMELLL